MTCLVRLPAGEPPVTDVVGVWDVQTTPVSFAAGDGAPSTEPVIEWLVTLPGDIDAAAAAQEQRLARVAATHHAIPDAQYRWRRTLFEAQHNGPVSFGAASSGAAGSGAAGSGAASDRTQAELELARLLRSGTAPQAYGLDDHLPAAWQQRITDVKNFVNNARETLTYMTVAKTEIEAELVGKTYVGWLGNIDTAYDSSMTINEAELHRQTLLLALESRRAWLHIGAELVECATLITRALAGDPIGAMQAVCSVWDLIQEIIARYQTDLI